MAEVTGIITAEFTEVTKNFENNEYLQKRDFGQWIESRLKEKYGGFDDIKVVKVQVFEFPDQPKAPKLTKRERLFCELVEKGFMARDKDGVCFWYDSKPHKTDGEGIWSNDGDVLLATKMTFDIDFNFIQWEDDLPWAVEDLLKLEVEE